MTARARQLLGAAVLLGAGVLIGRGVGGREGAPVAAPPETRVVAVPIAAPQRGASPTVEELRAMIRAELRERSVPAPAADTDPPVSSVPPEAIARAEQVLDDAVARGVWRADDRAAFRAALGELPGPERAAMLARFAASVNGGALRPDDLDGPF